MQIIDTSVVRPASAISELSQSQASTDATAKEEYVKPIRARRLSDKILIAFHQACDQRDILVAYNLLGALESLLRKSPPVGDSRQKTLKVLVAAHERLWHIKYSVNFPFSNDMTARHGGG
jgi:hypothetical protein